MREALKNPVIFKSNCIIELKYQHICIDYKHLNFFGTLYAGIATIATALIHPVLFKIKLANNTSAQTKSTDQNSNT